MQLPSMLERRRKRRTSALVHSHTPDGSLEESTEADSRQQDETPAQSYQQLLKSTAKRKLDASELEEPALQHPSKEQDDFIFQRRQPIWNTASAGAKKGSRFTRPPGREDAVTSEPALRSPQKAESPARKILAPKSTNSPTKRQVRVSSKLKDNHEDQRKPASFKLSRRNDHRPPLDTENIAQVVKYPSGEEMNLPPKTPAADVDGILSPLSTEPSARNENLPKEAAGLNSVEDVLNGSIGRGSRRARAAVSYAEPNLRDKMRRPGKELVGAVEGLDKSKEPIASTRGTSVDRAKSADVRSNEDQSKVFNANIKQERDDSADAQWKELPMTKEEGPASPLKDKERKERASVSTEEQHAADGLEKAVGRLSIFDPPNSSPMEATNDASTDQNGPKMPSTSRRKPSASSSTTRRHSVQPSSSSLATRISMAQLPANLQSIPSELKTSAVRSARPRPSSAASSRNEQLASIANEIKRSNSVSSHLKAKDREGAEAGNLANARAERTLNRRRSMMV